MMPVSSPARARSFASASSNARSASSSVCGRALSACVMSNLSTCLDSHASADDSTLSSGLPASLDHHRADLLGLDRRAEVVPLTVLAVVPRQEQLLLLRLDALGNGVEREAVRDRQDGAADDLRTLALRNVREERAVDLERSEERRVGKECRCRTRREQ